MFTNWNQFITWEKSTKDTIDVKKTYIDISGDFMAGVLLSQIVYWYLPNKQGKSKLRVKKAGHYWIAKKREEWYDEIRFSEQNYKTAIKKLEKEKLVVKERFKFDGAPTTHIRLNISVFLRKLNDLMQQEQSKLDEELQDFHEYLEQEITSEPLHSMDSVKSTEWKRLNPPNGFGEINRMKTVESTESLTESTTKITKEITNNQSIRNEELQSLIDTVFKKEIKTDWIDAIHDIYDLFKDEIKLPTFKRILNDVKAHIPNIAKGKFKAYLKASVKNEITPTVIVKEGASQPIRTEIVPEWMKKNQEAEQNGQTPEQPATPVISEERKREIWEQVLRMTSGNHDEPQI